MSKVANAIKTLKIIHDNKIIMANEIAKELNVGERQVRCYITQLKKVGIEIKSKSGATGGYYIDNWKCPICESWEDRSNQKEVDTTK